MTDWLRTHRAPILHWTVTVVLAVLVGVAFASVIQLAQESQETEQALERARERSAERQAAIDLLAEDQSELRDQLLELGEIPRVPDRDFDVVRIEGPEGPRGPRGPAPSVAAVRAAVTRYLSANPPDPGRPPSRAEVDAAVTAFCADGRCRGADGESVTGPRGPAGESIQGPQGPQGETGDRGPGPTDEQVAEAVAAYCDARDGCRGPRGETGQRGPAGADSEVPGPQGPEGPPGEQGPPGPTCPDGYELRERTGPPPERETWFVCVEQRP